MSHDPVGRFTWLAIDKTGSAVWEDEVGSLRSVPSTTIHQLAVVDRSDPNDSTRHVVVTIPDNATPVCFWRTATTIPTTSDGGFDLDHQTQTVTRVIGWKRGSDTTLVWIHDDGSVLITDHDPED